MWDPPFFPGGDKHGNGIDRALKRTETAADAGLRVFQAGAGVQIARFARELQAEAIDRAGIQTDGAGHAQRLINEGFRPFRTLAEFTDYA